MFANFLLIFFFWTVPCAIYLGAPFGSAPTESMVSIVFWTNALMYAPCVAWAVLGARSFRAHVAYRSIRAGFVAVTQCVILAINSYILYSTGFSLGIVDDSIRLGLYESAGYLWSLLVSLYCLSYVCIGVGLVGSARSRRFTKILAIINLIIFVCYGMKGGVVQIALSYIAGRLMHASLIGRARVIFGLVAATGLTILGFWVVNSLRAGESLGIIEFVELVYLYIAPNFTNFSHVIGRSFDYPYIFGGLLGGIYKAVIAGYYAPLSLLSVDDLEYQTWNVWSYLATLYVSGGLIELFVGTFLIGAYVTLSLIWYKRRPTLVSATNLSQMLLLLLFLHNQYYYSSFAPFFSMTLGVLLARFIEVRGLISEGQNARSPQLFQSSLAA